MPSVGIQFIHELNNRFIADLVIEPLVCERAAVDYES